jgi:drug/metabolite transporter (DMT)-like permease
MGARRFLPTLLLVLASVVWGLSFLVTSRGVSQVPPLIFVSLRFAAAAVAVRALAQPRMLHTTRIEIRAGLVLGCAMLGIYGFQALGMRTVESGRTAFISSLYVPIVPLLQLLIQRRRPAATVWVGVGLACAGLMLLAGPQPGESAPLSGEALVLGAAFCAACEILLIGNFARRCDPRRLAVVECLVVAALALILSRASGEPWPTARLAWLLPATTLGVASAFLQISVNWAQRSVPPARATLIYALEPVWAGIAGALAGEHMGRMQVFGAAMIVLALMVSARRPASAYPDTTSPDS